MKIYKPILSFLIFTCLLAVLPLLAGVTGNGSWLTPGFWHIFLFMSVLTLIVIIIVLFAKQKNDELFAQAFLAGTTFKLLACLTFVFIFIRKNHPEKMIFLLDFMYLYFLNTVFEIYGLLRNLRNQNLR